MASVFHCCLLIIFRDCLRVEISSPPQVAVGLDYTLLLRQDGKVVLSGASAAEVPQGDRYVSISAHGETAVLQATCFGLWSGAAVFDFL